MLFVGIALVVVSISFSAVDLLSVEDILFVVVVDDDDDNDDDDDDDADDDENDDDGVAVGMRGQSNGNHSDEENS